MLVVVCPGQGAQAPGMLSPWLELPGARSQLQWLSAVCGLDLVAHGTTSDAATIRDTAVAQPLLVASGLVALRALLPSPEDVATAVSATAGHSVGEITAAVVAGVLTPEQALVLVRERGRAMAAAAAVTRTGMSAVVGGDPEEVEAAVARAGATAANRNGGGQVVAAGTLEQLAALAADPPARARVIPLQVAGAFHTEHMAPAVEVLERYAPAIAPADPRVLLLSNADGAVVADGAQVLRRVVAQVANPVRWDLCQETLAGLGVTGLVELVPGGTLTGLARRSLPGVEAVALRTPDDLDAARDLLARHGAPAPQRTGAPSPHHPGSPA
ncbi:[acyl-carrier-protein] S-malonyltransferase [Quadrisphaera sp. DSM 44207]|nr:[acyl-carrier-protein] S-malonyltransferase [Quadrisphaera sp. DSM 44207]